MTQNKKVLIKTTMKLNTSFTNVVHEEYIKKTFSTQI